MFSERERRVNRPYYLISMQSSSISWHYKQRHLWATWHGDRLERVALLSALHVRTKVNKRNQPNQVIELDWPILVRVTWIGAPHMLGFYGAPTLCASSMSSSPPRGCGSTCPHPKLWPHWPLRLRVRAPRTRACAPPHYMHARCLLPPWQGQRMRCQAAHSVSQAHTRQANCQGVSDIVTEWDGLRGHCVAGLVACEY